MKLGLAFGNPSGELCELIGVLEIEYDPDGNALVSWWGWEKSSFEEEVFSVEEGGR